MMHQPSSVSDPESLSQEPCSHEFQHEVLVHKALSQPIRLLIVRALFQFCEMNQQDLSQELGIKKTTLTRHLQILELPRS